MGFLCVLKMYHERIYIVEKIGFGTALKQCEIRSKPQPLLQKTCLSYTFETVVMYGGICLCMHALACVHRLQQTYAGRGPLWSFYFQKQIFAYLKGYIFYFYTPQVNLISNQALNWPWALEFKHYWGMRARVVRGTKCSVYRCPFFES